MELTNQEKRLLDYLQKYLKINPIEALTDLGIYRLSDVVFRLRNKGYDINTKRVTRLNRYDEPCSFAEYELKRAS